MWSSEKRGIIVLGYEEILTNMRMLRPVHRDRPLHRSGDDLLTPHPSVEELRPRPVDNSHRRFEVDHDRMHS